MKATEAKELTDKKSNPKINKYFDIIRVYAEAGSYECVVKYDYDIEKELLDLGYKVKSTLESGNDAPYMKISWDNTCDWKTIFIFIPEGPTKTKENFKLDAKFGMGVSVGGMSGKVVRVIRDGNKKTEKVYLDTKDDDTLGSVHENTAGRGLDREEFKELITEAYESITKNLEMDNKDLKKEIEELRNELGKMHIKLHDKDLEVLNMAEQYVKLKFSTPREQPKKKWWQL